MFHVKHRGPAGWLADELEPSRLRAVIVAGCGLAFALGLIATADLPGWVDPLLGAWVVVAPWIQHVLVRPKVTPVAKIERVLAETPSLSTWSRAELESRLVTGAPVSGSPYDP